MAGGVGSVAPAAAQGPDGSGLFAPLDPEDWVNQADTTWDDYVPVPGKPAGWADGSIKGMCRTSRRLSCWSTTRTSRS